jgi:transcriptional regulator with XRE-family HTH domain
MKQLKLKHFVHLFASRLNELGYRNASTGKRGGKTYTMFAVKAGIDQTSVGHYIAGRYKPSYPTLEKIAKALKVDLSYFGVNERKPVYVGTDYVRKTARPYVKKKSAYKPKNSGKADFRLLELNTNQLTEIEIIMQNDDNNLLLIKIVD